MNDVCDWIETHDGWETDCGHMIVIVDKTPDEDGITHCTHCGRPIKSYLGTEFEGSEDQSEGGK